MKTSPINDGKPYKHATPSASHTMETDSEIRIELPFHYIFENLTYIGVLLQEIWHVAPHYHDHFELCYVDEGRGWFSIDEYLYEVSAGDLFLTKPGEGHQGAAAGDQPYRLYYMGFKLVELRSMEADFYKIGIHRTARDEKGQIKMICDGIFAEIRDNLPNSQQMVQGLFMQMLVTVLRAFETKRNSVDKRPLTLPPVIRQVLAVLNTKEGFQTDVEELARSVSLSRSHLDRVFKQFIGISAGKYIRQLTIDRAKHYLRETSESVTDISAHLNFESIHHFSIFFKRHTEMSPQEYRKSTK